MEERKYYVYRYRIKETKEVFYIGKGSDRRYKDTNKRNEAFKNIYNSNECEVQILWNHMTEEEAFLLEKTLIAYYRQFTNFPMTNISDGGEGPTGHKWTEEERKAISLREKGEKNGNYGHKWTDEMKKALSQKQKNSGRYIGSKNPNSKKVMCVETGEIFNTMSDAASKYGLKYPSSIYHALKTPNRLAANLHWKLIQQ